MRNLIYILMTFSLILSGCAPAVIGAGAAGAYKTGTDERSVGTLLDDSSISSRVKIHLVEASDVKGRSIDVDVLQGVVTLTGLVESPDMKKRAEEIALSIEGVKSVTNLLSVGRRTFGQAMEDKLLVGKINKDLIAEPDMKSWSVDVDAYNGVVTLTGIVENATMKKRALEIASETKGVVKVVDNLKVSER